MFSVGDRTYGDRPLIMGILNVTPDSFSDGGRYNDTMKAVDRALSMIDEGADIIDIGGESSRPGADAVGVDVELSRVIPVISALSGKTPIPISIDTYRAEVAKQAADAGAMIVNDISALRFDRFMADVVAERGLSIVLMHMQGSPRTMQADPAYSDVVEEIYSFLAERISFAVEHGISREKIVVDPGIGFGKTLAHNLDILRRIDRFRDTGCPVLVGASRKGMIGAISGAGVGDRLPGTAAITAHCVLRGILIHRVHDVGAMRQACDVAYAIYNGFRMPEG